MKYEVTNCACCRLIEQTQRDVNLYNKNIYPKNTSKLEYMMTIMNDYYKIMVLKNDPIMKKIILEKCKEFELSTKDKPFIKFIVDLKERVGEVKDQTTCSDRSNHYNLRNLPRVNYRE